MYTGVLVLWGLRAEGFGWIRLKAVGMKVRN